LVGDACRGVARLLDIPVAAGALVALAAASPAAATAVLAVATLPLALIRLARARAFVTAPGPPSLALAVGTLRRIDSWRTNGESDVVFASQMGRLATNLDRAQTLGGAAVIGQALLGVAVACAALLALSLSPGGAGARLAQAGLGAIVAAVSARLAAGRRRLARLEELALRAEDFSDVPVEETRARRASDPVTWEAHGLGFASTPGQPARIADVSIHVARGELVGVRGGSGSGRSTLGMLLAGVLPPTAGVVRVCGPRGDEPPAGCVAYLGVTDLLVGATVAEVVAFARPDATRQDVRRALEDAALLEDLTARPGGIDAAVADGAGNFSGGERRRLSIARALLGDKPFVVLDETADALDDQRVAELAAGLRRRRVGCVWISHRERTLAGCDRVLELAGGRLRDGAAPGVTP
jgi:ABC-type multidrug transport system fused ATPase/permease subunit